MEVEINITLSADETLIKQGRAYAHAHITSLNQLIRDYLAKLTGGNDAKKMADEFVRLAGSMPGRSDEDFVFSRDAVYDRHAL